MDSLRERIEKLAERCEAFLRSEDEPQDRAARSMAGVVEQLRAILAEPDPSPWRPINDVCHSLPVLVSRPTDSLIYVPTTAFMDAVGVWRVFRSPFGERPLSFEPTHYMPLPEPPK